MLGRAAAFAAIALILSAQFAWADDITNNLDGSVDAAAELMTLTLGGLDGSTVLAVIPTGGDGKSGCNLTGSTVFSASVTSSNAAVATVSPASVTFTSCGDTKTLTVHAVAAGSATITLTQTANTTGGTFNLAPATFNVTIAAPPPSNTPPSVSVIGVSHGAIYEIGAVPAAACLVVDTEDGSQSVSPSLSAITGPLAGLGLGSQTATCTYTDLGGLTNTNSATYSIVDSHGPTVSITTTASIGLQGWYNFDSSGAGGIVVTVNASDAVGVTDLSCTDNGAPIGTIDSSGDTATLGDGVHAIVCTAHDASSNPGSDSETFQVDQTAPSLTASVAPAPNGAGWNNTSVVVSFTCTDATSGIDPGYGCPIDETLTANGHYELHKATADLAGNVVTPSFLVDIDAELPTIFGSRTPAANANGWNNTDVNVHFDCFDGLSTLASCTADTLLTAEGANQSVTGTAVDLAGNSNSFDVAGISIDKSDPIIGVASRTPANGAGWNHAAVTVTFSCSDALSGVDIAPTTVVLSGEGAAQSATGTCVDKAGNNASTTVHDINIDLTNPLITGLASPGANAFGWNNSDVVVSFTCSDDLSGVATDTVSGDTLTGEGTGLGVTNSGDCIDAAGNHADAVTIDGIKIDRTAPTITGSATPEPNAFGWNSGPVTVGFSCTDGGSTVSGIDVDSVAGDTLSTDGAGQSVTNTGDCVDRAGNPATAATVNGINIDQTDPAILFLGQSPASNANGWNKSAVDLSWSCSDGLSGPQAATVTETLTGEGANQSATGTCLDKAGNDISDTHSDIDIDLTDPHSITFVGDIDPGESFVFGSVPAAPTCTAADALSGLASCIVSGYGTAVGGHTLTATATDKADNDATANRSYTVASWTLKGFYQPVDMSGIVNTVKGGSTVPLKFEVFAGATELTDTSIVSTLIKTATCTTGLPEDTIEVTATGGTSLRYDTTGGQYIFNWQTPKLPGRCYTVTLTTLDGSTLNALFKLK